MESLAAISRTVTCTVLVAPGTYTLTRNDDDPITVTNAIRVVGTGATPEAVVFQRTEDARAGTSPTTGRSWQDLSLFHLNHPDALVANLVLQNGRAHQPPADTTAGSAWIGTNGGTISNCVVRGGSVSHPQATTSGILMMGLGLVTHCVISNNACTAGMEPDTWGKSMVGTAVVIKGKGARLENCLICGNQGGTKTNDIERMNTVSVNSEAVIANCTIVENQARKCAGVYVEGGKAVIRNCVIAGNVDSGADPGNPNWMGTATFVACATDDAEPINETCFSGSLASFFPRLAENVPVALKFRPAAGGPLCDRGVDYEPMAGVDLSGVQPRKIGAHVDIGCCEAESGQTSGYAAWIAANGKVVCDANGNPALESRDLAPGRDDVTFDVLATEDLSNWSQAALIPMTVVNGLWKPTASESPNYVFPAKMFFKYTIVVR